MQDDFAPAGQAVFKTQLFGFNRTQVLSYIERISNANAEKARALDDTIARLQRELDSARDSRDEVAEKARQVCEELTAQKQQAEEAFRQAAQLREDVKKATDETALMRANLFAKEKENIELKRDNARLNKTIDSLTETLAQKEADMQRAGELAQARDDANQQRLRDMETQAEAKLADARLQADALLRDAEKKAQLRRDDAEREAQVIVARAKGEKVQARAQLAGSADGIAASITVLRAQLADVDRKIKLAAGDLERATEGLADALDLAARDAENLGARMRRFPEAEQEVPAQQRAAEREAHDTYERQRREAARAAEEARLREEARRRAAAEEAARQEEARRVTEQARYEEALRRTQYEEQLRQQRYYEDMAREQLRHAQMQEELDRRRYGMPYAYPAPYMPAYTMAPPLYPDYGYRPYAPYPGQYPPAGVQSVPPVPAPPVQPAAPAQPSVPAQDEAEPAGFGRPHRPSAMPFAPFEEDEPHTPPYPRDEAQAQQLGVPSAPPQQMPPPEKYVPRPTPVAPVASFSQPYTPPETSGLDEAPGVQPMPQQPIAEEIDLPAQQADEEPVIIPETAPIPEAARPAPKKPEQEKAPKETPYFARKVARRPPSLSDTLLDGINALLNGNHK